MGCPGPVSGVLMMGSPGVSGRLGQVMDPDQLRAGPLAVAMTRLAAVPALPLSWTDNIVTRPLGSTGVSAGAIHRATGTARSPRGLVRRREIQEESYESTNRREIFGAAVLPAGKWASPLLAEANESTRRMTAGCKTTDYAFGPSPIVEFPSRHPRNGSSEIRNQQ